MVCNIALSAAPQFISAAFEEIRGVDRSALVVEWMAPSIAHVAVRLPYDAFAAALRERRPVYIRHICPLLAKVELSGSQRDIEQITRSAQDLASVMHPEAAAALTVQARGAGGFLPHSPGVIGNRVQTAIAPSPAADDVRWVISIIVSADRAWLGLSSAADNLNPWPGGERHYARDEHTIGRAEFKLREAVELFGLALPKTGHALDLGAAPGGWTRLLRRYGLDVIAVDPGDLHPSLLADPHVHHVRQLAESFLLQQTQQTAYDIIVNDMRLDIAQSVALMCSAAPRLKRGGTALMTLKLPVRRGPQLVRSAAQTLQRCFTIVAMRQLFHNRSEVTVALAAPHFGARP